MKEFDEYGLKMCQYQGNLFRKSVERTKCSSLIFLRRFMYSKTAERMDKEGILFEAFSAMDVIEEIENDYGESDYGTIRYSQEELYWIGYIYRYWSYTREISSKALYRLVKPEELRKLYFPYHSLDPDQAIERIMESKGMAEIDYIKRGVEILKRIRSKNGK